MSDSNEDKIKRLSRIADLIYNQEIMTKVGLAFETKVRQRTRQGKDISGNDFKPYSEGYLGVRSRAGEPEHPVNLTMDHITGMLTQVEHVVFSDLTGVQAYVRGDKARIGRYHAIEGAGKSKVIREWWGLSDKQIDELEKLVRTEVNKILEAEL